MIKSIPMYALSKAAMFVFLYSITIIENSKLFIEKSNFCKFKNYFPKSISIPREGIKTPSAF